MNSSSVSVLMSVYNGEKYLHEAIESIVNQTFKDFEFIIVDDGSQDKSVNIINSFDDPRIILIKQKNKGLAVSLNVAIRAARGKYIARMDADDISMKNRLRMQWDFLEAHPECVAVGSNAINIDMNGELLYTSKQLCNWKEISGFLPKTPFFHSSTMLSRKVVIECGGYFEEIKHHFEDRLLWNKMAEIGELRNIEAPLIKYRIGPSAITNRTSKTNLIFAEISNNILRDGAFSSGNSRLLKKLTRKRSERWKMSNYYLQVGKIFIEQDFQREKSAKNLFFAILNYPINGNAWFNLVLLILPKSIIKKWKKHRGVF